MESYIGEGLCVLRPRSVLTRLRLIRDAGITTTFVADPDLDFKLLIDLAIRLEWRRFTLDRDRSQNYMA